MNEPSEEVKEETIDKMQQLIGRLKTERMSQAEFEQYAKEHGYIICTTNIIEQIREEIANEKGTFPKEHYIRIIDKYTKGE